MRLVLPVALLLSLTFAGCGSDSEEAATTAPASAGQTIEIGETEFALDPAKVQVDETGAVTFRVTNNGSIPHSLEVDGQGVEEETETIDPGASAELTVDLSKEGSYELYCPIGNHRDQGMEAELIVGAAGGGGTGTMEDENEDEDEDDDGGSTTSGTGYR
jgi:plastocyanin